MARRPRPRYYTATAPDECAWRCPDCGALVAFFAGRSIHNRWHADLARRLSAIERQP